MNKYLLLVAVALLNISPRVCAVMHGYGEIGIALAHPYTYNWDKVRIIEFGYMADLNKTFQVRGNIGGWSDRSEYRRLVHDAVYQSLQLGLETKVVGTYLEYYIGPAIISNRDTMLGSYFQITQELGIGKRDARGVKIGIAWKHFSNAGMSKINKGRNFIVLKAEF